MCVQICWLINFIIFISNFRQFLDKVMSKTPEEIDYTDEELN